MPCMARGLHQEVVKTAPKHAGRQRTSDARESRQKSTPSRRQRANERATKKWRHMKALFIVDPALEDGFGGTLACAESLLPTHWDQVVSVQLGSRGVPHLLDVTWCAPATSHANGAAMEVRVPLAVAEDLGVGAHLSQVAATVRWVPQARERFALTRVVLCATSDARAINGWPLVVRRALELVPGVRVVDCAPYAEGFIAPHTIVAVLPPPRPAQQPFGAAVATSSSSGLPLVVSAFAAPPHAAPPVTVSVHTLHALQGAALQAPVALLKRLGVFADSLCVLRSPQAVTRVVRVSACPPASGIDDTAVVYASPSVMLNALARNGAEPAADVVAGVTLEPLGPLDPSPPYAAEVRLARVGHSEVGSAESLALHFSTTRLLCVGDVVCVEEQSSDDAEAQRLRESASTAASAAYARDAPTWCVVAVEPNLHGCAYVQRDSCSLFEDPSTQRHAFLPPRIPRSSTDKALFDLILPWFVSSASPHVAPAILVHSSGPGYGKRRRVHAIGQAVGVAVLHYSAYEMLSDVTANTQQSLATVFDNARARAPCILLLDHIEALSQCAPHAASQRTAAQMESLFAASVATLRGLVGVKRIVLVATADQLDRVGASVASCFLRTEEVHTPTDDERKVA